MKTIGDVGEFGLIARIKSICGGAVPPDVLVGIGDDTAVIRIDDQRALVATCDIQVEGVHFHWGEITPEQLGRRAMAVNLSDIASMGARPQYALVSIASPPSLPVERFEAMYAGLHTMAREHDVVIVGGNLARTSDKLVVDIFLWGIANPSQVVTRAGAQVGDLICVTGTLGSAAAGADVIARFGSSPPAEYAGLVRAHLEPEPRVSEGHLLASTGALTSMIDISDGLAADLGHVCDASGVGAALAEEQIPRDAALEAFATALKKDVLHYILHGGEDYELLFTVRPDGADAVEAVAREHGVPMRRIGRIVPFSDGRYLIDKSGDTRALANAGWDHFSE